MEVDLSFGPNLLNEAVDESVIEQYGVFRVEGESCNVGSNAHLKVHNSFNDSIALVAKLNLNTPDNAAVCDSGLPYCEKETYTVHLANLALPADGTPLRLMVAPIISGGFVLPLGLTTDPIEDFVDTPYASIGGTITLSVSDPQAFIADSLAKQGVLDGIAAICGLSPDYVGAAFSVLQVQGRLLCDISGRALSANSGVTVSYTVVILSAISDKEAILSQASAALSSTTFDAFTAAVATSVASSRGSGVYAVSVVQVDQPEVVYADPAPQGAENDNTTVVIIIVVAVVAVLMLWAVLVAYRMKGQSPPPVSKDAPCAAPDAPEGAIPMDPQPDNSPEEDPDGITMTI